MATQVDTKNIGLRGIVVADSTICKVDGEAGRLVYRGFDAVTLAENSTYEEVVYLLLYDELPSGTKLADFREQISGYSSLPGQVVNTMKAIDLGTNTMEMLQALVPLLAAHDPDLSNSNDKTATRRQAMRLIARMPLIVAAWHRLQQGHDVVEPDPKLSIAGNFLYTMHGKKPSQELEKDMDAILILHAEHSFNASTFTCRQVASTQAHIYAAVASAIGSLSGPLHGGANERVKRMLDEIGTVDNVVPYVRKTLDEGGKIYGMGHAVYKVLDPRAKVLGPMAKRLADLTGDRKLYDLAVEVQKVTKEEFQARKGVDLNANVDFFSATVYPMMGIPMELFTPIFALARTSGWCAHYIEERFAEAQPKPALYRPRAEYTGRYCGPDGCEWVPRDQRST